MKASRRAMRLWGLLLLLGLGVGVAGCNTMEGAGRDVERAGEKIQGAADRDQR